ncbi:MAG: hypothetical protein ACREJ5_06390 [Geminicoccaceae bacterium]
MVPLRPRGAVSALLGGSWRRSDVPAATITDVEIGARGDTLALGDLLSGFTPGSEADRATPAARQGIAHHTYFLSPARPLGANRMTRIVARPTVQAVAK